MENGLDILTFLKKAETIPTIDVRTPAEYEQGHIPNAYNIPLFSNEERKRVGTTFKQSGQKDAVMMGLEFVGPKMKELVIMASKIALEKQLLVHCWRGGMRSASMAWLFRTVGLESMVLEGGYKSFRRFVLEFFKNNFPFIVIGGYTGSGKTEILQELKNMGEQVIDLEGLAHHKGSAFGGLGEIAQSTNEQFENDLFLQLFRFNKDRIVWIEDESRMIGKNTLPAGIHRNIRSAPMIFLKLAFEDRIKNLVKDYAHFSRKDLIDSISKIRPRLGDQTARSAIKGIENGNYDNTAELVLHYYDKTYKYGLDKRNKDLVHNLAAENASVPKNLAQQIFEFVRHNRISDQIL